MLYEIKNDKLSVSADTFGAELHSIKLDSKEYLWQCGDAWKRYAPILFPFICSPKDRTYKAGGQEYHMAANHGFARDSEFTYAGSTKNSLSFLLKDNDVTLAQYPYHFELEVTYSIKGSKVTVTNTVKNTDEKAMYFYLGGHPAFICDIQGGKCTVEYEKNEHIVQPIPNGERTILDGEKTITLTRELSLDRLISHPCICHSVLYGLPLILNICYLRLLFAVQTLKQSRLRKQTFVYVRRFDIHTSNT